MAKVQKVYTREFKEQAVQLAQTSGKPITQVARELGISDTSIHQWRKELAQHSKEAFPGSGHQTPLEEENRRLKRELERVQQERDILKKVVSIFSRESKGNCWDNAAMESFFGTLKEECVGTTVYSSHEQARQALFEYLEVY